MGSPNSFSQAEGFLKQFSSHQCSSGQKLIAGWPTFSTGRKNYKEKSADKIGTV